MEKANQKQNSKLRGAALRKRKRRHLLWILPVLAIFMGLTGFLICWFTMDAGIVNESSVPVEELQIYVDQARSDTISYYYKNFGADSNKNGFWDTAFGGESPRTHLLNTARQNLILNRTLREEARLHGIEAAVDFAAQKGALEEENKIRRAQTQGTSVIYGTEQYTMIQFLSYQKTELTDALKKVLLKTELKPTEQNLRDAYAKLDKTVLDKGYKGDVMRFICSDAKRSETIFGELEKLLHKGTAVENITKMIRRSYGSVLTVSEVSLGPDLHREDTALLAIYDQCRNLPQGSFSKPQLTGGNAELYFMKSKTDYGQMSFEEAGDYSSTAWINDHFDQYLQQKASEAKVQWNEAALRRVRIS